ncbi:MAG: Gfo/Idh/MocA family oxidoreductase [Candidatus Omnitrophica bacterium]|nr:Gfo/Idh/MocA family oxidoreductase [Candidatus Omnitrophota bacterium]MDD5311130.1 Gfo/Idh/MocA family oxidoreductase [Candidatus Omnitrophota bacterium]MDD5546454.1 Gfo/Idh/MocA family oxidoreductase [Candidatus Omnitrophota bacterium]
MDKIKVGVIGVGHLGQHHARIYAGMEGVELAGICDIDIRRAKKLARKYRATAFTDYKQMFGVVNCASVVVPTELHYHVAKDCLLNGISVLIEKPVTKFVGEADDLLNIARERKLIIQVGHIERFNAAVRALDEIPGNVRFIECHRLGPFKKRALDVGVVLDLMIHDIDIILGLVKSEISSIDAVGVNILTDHEDLANVRIRFKNGAVANLTASRVTKSEMRKIRLFKDDCYVSLDYIKQEAVLYRKVNNRITGKLINIKKEEPLKKELEAFINCVRTGERPLVSGEEGRDALKFALQIEDAIRENLKNNA